MRLAVVGLGKLGAPLAALLAARGHQVTGADGNLQTVEAVVAGRPPVTETGLAELMAEAGGRLTATTDTRAAVVASEATFVIVPTPSGPDGRFSTALVEAAMADIGAGLRGRKDYHLVVLVSTVMPGDTGGPIRAALEAAAGRPCGPDLGLCYNPEFIALGSVIADMRRPDFILIGENDVRAGDILASIHAGLADNHPPIARLSPVEAELAKIAVNTFVTMRLSYANMLAEACERLPGADVDRVTRAIGLDTRVGRRYLTGALSYGGPCFPRDNGALAAALRGLGLDGTLPKAVDAANQLHAAHVAERVRSLLPPGGTAGILGLAYKPGTGVIEESAAMDLARRLVEGGASVIVHDPQAMPAAQSVLGNRVRFADSMVACAEAADVLTVAVPWPDYAELSPAHLRQIANGAPPIVVDCWRVLDRDRFARACRLVAIGRGTPGGTP